MTRIECMREVVESRTAAMIEECFVDLFSASAYIQIFDALNVEHQENLEGRGIGDAMSLVWQLVGKLSENARKAS